MYEFDLYPLSNPTSLSLSLSLSLQVHMAVGGGPSSECVSQKFNIRITRADIATLVGLQWLNDEASHMTSTCHMT